MRKESIHFSKFVLLIVMFTLLFTLALGSYRARVIHAATAKEIDVSVEVALDRFYKFVQGGKEFLDSAKGMLVFPGVYKAGFVVGGEYGEGALIAGGETVGYYNTIAGSFGLQLGGQKKTIIIVFMEDTALKAFQASSGWEVGIDGSVALITVGVGGSVDTTNIKDPIVAFVFGQKGLMFNLTLEGSKFNRMVR